MSVTLLTRQREKNDDTSIPTTTTTKTTTTTYSLDEGVVSSGPVRVCVDDVGETEDGQGLYEVAVEVPDGDCPSVLWRLLLVLLFNGGLDCLGVDG